MIGNARVGILDRKTYETSHRGVQHHRVEYFIRKTNSRSHFWSEKGNPKQEMNDSRSRRLEGRRLMN